MCPCRFGQAVIDMMKLFHGCLQWQLEEEKRENIFQASDAAGCGGGGGVGSWWGGKSQHIMQERLPSLKHQVSALPICRAFRRMGGNWEVGCGGQEGGGGGLD